MNPEKTKEDIKRSMRSGTASMKHELTLESLNLLFPFDIESLSDQELKEIMNVHARFQLYNSQSFTLGWDHFKKKMLRAKSRTSQVTQVHFFLFVLVVSLHLSFLALIFTSIR
jgi:hypothetical protein